MVMWGFHLLDHRLVRHSHAYTTSKQFISQCEQEAAQSFDCGLLTSNSLFASGNLSLSTASTMKTTPSTPEAK